MTGILAAVITVSDRCSRGEQRDDSGPALVDLLRQCGAEVAATEVVSDDMEGLERTLRRYADMKGVNLIVTTGGTGLGPRDNTPEATRAVIEREAPGPAEAIRAESSKKTPLGMLSRGVCGISNGTLILNFPGSPRAVRECFEVVRAVLPHAIRLLAGDTAHNENESVQSGSAGD